MTNAATQCRNHYSKWKFRKWENYVPKFRFMLTKMQRHALGYGFARIYRIDFFTGSLKFTLGFLYIFAKTKETGRSFGRIGLKVVKIEVKFPLKSGVIYRFNFLFKCFVIRKTNLLRLALEAKVNLILFAFGEKRSGTKIRYACYSASLLQRVV